MADRTIEGLDGILPTTLEAPTPSPPGKRQTLSPDRKTDINHTRPPALEIVQGRA